MRFLTLAAAAPCVITLLVAGPIGAGLLGTVLPALGYLPAIGATQISLEPFAALLAEPGFGRAGWLALSTGLGGAALALLLALLIMAALVDSPLWRLVRGLTPSLLAIPHAALAIGLVFLIAPSGLLIRLGIEILALDQSVPPDWLIVQDRHGLALMAALALREAPFLLFTLIAASHRVAVERQLKIARSLGYRRMEAWLFVLLPQLYGRIRLPVLIVIAYGVTNAEIALVLGPTSPPTLTLLILEWFRDPDLSQRLLGAAGAMVALVLVGLSIGLWSIWEQSVKILRRRLVNAGHTRMVASLARGLGVSAAGLVYLLGVVAIAVLVLWSVAHRWPFPSLWPESLSLVTWRRAGEDLVHVGLTTLGIGVIAASTALILTVLTFEHQTSRHGGAHHPRRMAWGLGLLTLPLLLPQISLVFGLQIAMIRIGLAGSWVGVVLAHLLFVLPYTMLILADPYRALDPRYARTARSLGHGTWTVFWRVKLPLLAHPMALAWAIGFSVSCAQYLTTLFVGQGRVVTLSLEALALMGAGDRRLTAATALILAILPLLGFVIALIAPRLLWPQLHGPRLTAAPSR